jgi:hypothetical protein
MKPYNNEHADNQAKPFPASPEVKKNNKPVKHQFEYSCMPVERRTFWSLCLRSRQC